MYLLLSELYAVGITTSFVSAFGLRRRYQLSQRKEGEPAIQYETIYVIVCNHKEFFQLSIPAL